MATAPTCEIEAPFPPPPIGRTRHLVPITSWTEMHQEATDMGIMFDLFWYQSVTEGAAYFFRWLSDPRCTVLVVWDDAGPTLVECRKRGDVLASDDETAPILGEIIAAFRAVGQWPEQLSH
jgi:hypothetical protein